MTEHLQYAIPLAWIAAVLVLLWALDRNDHHDDGPW